MTHEASIATKRQRYHFLDNLRAIIILLVVLYHAGGVYESGGGWTSFWLVDDPATSDVVGILLIMFDIFMMPVLFFISGYLTPRSLEKKGAGSFLKVRFNRLIIPWFVGVILLIPLYKVIFLFSRGLSPEHWTTYFHFSMPSVSSQAWLWFLPVLFVFNLLYVLLKQSGLAPEKMSFGLAAGIVFVLSFAWTYTFDMMNARGWFLSPVLDFQKERVLLYFLMFLLGSLAYHKQIFAREPKSKTLYIVASSVAWMPIMGYVAFLLMPYIMEGGVLIAWPVDRLITWTMFYLSLLVMVYLLIESFRRYVNKTGPLWATLSGNSYYVYIIHVIVIGVFGTLLLYVSLPGLVKFLILGLVSYVVSNLLVSMYERLTRPDEIVPQQQAISA